MGGGRADRSGVYNTCWIGSQNTLRRRPRSVVSAVIRSIDKNAVAATGFDCGPFIGARVTRPKMTSQHFCDRRRRRRRTDGLIRFYLSLFFSFLLLLLLLFARYYFRGSDTVGPKYGCRRPVTAYRVPIQHRSHVTALSVIGLSRVEHTARSPRRCFRRLLRTSVSA